VSAHSRGRAAPLTPEARRASIIAAALPLLRLHGPGVTTAQIAMAAGVAEGTLFRVFPDKEALIGAAIESAFDPHETESALASIDHGLDLRSKLVLAVDILQRRIDAVWQLMAVMGMWMKPGDDPKKMFAPRREGIDEALRRTVNALIEPHTDELRCDAATAARLLRIMTFAGTHPRIADGQPLTAAEIVAVVLDGIRVRDDFEPEVP
jgi:AcrR family transcriptional regulator